MPVKYRIKDYKKGEYYHIYNRGIDGRVVFESDSDYRQFERMMELYLIGPQHDELSRFKLPKPSERLHMEEMCLKEEVQLYAYCLMPNHFHLLLKQESGNGIVKFMRRLMTGYVMRFNKAHGRSGPLFETTYRAVSVSGEEALLHMTRFIHRNPVTRIVKRFGPVETVSGVKAEDYSYSSYSHYIDVKPTNWVNIVEVVKDPQLYRKFTEDPRINSAGILKNLTIEASE